MIMQQPQYKQPNLNNPFGGITKDPAMQQGLLGNWAFNMANQEGNGGRSYFENFNNFPAQQGNDLLSGMQNTSAMNVFGNQQGQGQDLQGMSDKLLSAYDTHVKSPNLQADILFQDTFMGGNGNDKQELNWGLLG